MKLAIALTTNDRPVYLKDTLRALSRNDCDGWELYVRSEPDAPSCREVVDRIDFMPVHHVANETRLGVSANNKAAIQDAIDDGADFVLRLTDDQDLSPDALDACRWFATAPDAQGALTLWLFNHASDPEHPDLVRPTLGHEWAAYVGAMGFRSTASIWIPLAHVFSRWAWEQWFKPHWGHVSDGFDIAWGVALAEQFEAGAVPMGLQVATSRANHVGRIRGTHCSREYHDAVFGTHEIYPGPRILPDGFRLAKAAPERDPSPPSTRSAFACRVLHVLEAMGPGPHPLGEVSARMGLHPRDFRKRLNSMAAEDEADLVAGGLER